MKRIPERQGHRECCERTAIRLAVVRTNFGAEDQAWLFTVVSQIVLPFLKTPAQGAQTSIYLASSPKMDGVTGEFFANGKPKTANKVAYDTDLGEPAGHSRTCNQDGSGP